jgi:putative transcription antitermination factor YqgF
MIFSTIVDFLKQNAPLNGEFLGIDVGSKKTGIAVSVGERKLGIPSIVIYETNHAVLATKIMVLMKEKECNYAVFGFPFAWEEGASAKRILKLANILSNLKITCLLYDENRTSVYVKQTAFEEKGKMTKKELQNYDAKVAALILNNALDEINHHRSLL